MSKVEDHFANIGKMVPIGSGTEKVCPLLNMQPAEECSDPTCLGQLCAWYIPPEHPKTQPEGCCAITYLADIAHEIRYT